MTEKHQIYFLVKLKNKLWGYRDSNQSKIKNLGIMPIITEFLFIVAGAAESYFNLKNCLKNT